MKNITILLSCLVLLSCADTRKTADEQNTSQEAHKYSTLKTEWLNGKIKRAITKTYLEEPIQKNGDWVSEDTSVYLLLVEDYDTNGNIISSSYVANLRIPDTMINKYSYEENRLSAVGYYNNSKLLSKSTTNWINDSTYIETATLPSGKKDFEATIEMTHTFRFKQLTNTAYDTTGNINAKSLIKVLARNDSFRTNITNDLTSGRIDTVRIQYFNWDSLHNPKKNIIKSQISTGNTLSIVSYEYY